MEEYQLLGTKSCLHEFFPFILTAFHSVSVAAHKTHSGYRKSGKVSRKELLCRVILFCLYTVLSGHARPVLHEHDHQPCMTRTMTTVTMSTAPTFTMTCHLFYHSFLSAAYKETMAERIRSEKDRSKVGGSTL